MIMDKMMKEYLDRSRDIIGERTPDEIAHDDTVVESLNLGLPIKVALTVAGKKHPSEAVQWNSENIDDIAAHYEYLKEHEAIMQKLQKMKKR